jgi:hypothetical protein
LISSIVMVCSGSRRARICATLSVDRIGAQQEEAVARVPMQNEPRRICWSSCVGRQLSDE